MKKTLPSTEIPVAKNWLYDLFKSGGVVGHTNSNLKFDLLNTTASKQICDEIINRNFNFVRLKLDDKLFALSLESFRAPNKSKWIKRSASSLIDYIGWFCANNNIVWDDSLLTAQERTAIESTSFGKGLIDWGCFKSAQNQTARIAQPAGSARQVNAKQPGQAPANGYKSTGGHSADIPNLIGAAGQKINLTGILYCIEADPTGKNIPRAFITPLKTDRSGNIITISKADAEKIHFSSGNGYTDCTLWFITKADATSAYNFCINAFGNKFSNIHIAQAQASKGGYYCVSTDLGPAWISAKKLNEELDEALKYEKNPGHGFEITNVALYDEWMHRSDS